MKKMLFLGLALATMGNIAATTMLVSPSQHCKVTSVALSRGGYSVFISVQRHANGAWLDSWWFGKPLYAPKLPAKTVWSRQGDSGMVQFYDNHNKLIALTNGSGNPVITEISSPNFLLCMPIQV